MVFTLTIAALCLSSAVASSVLEEAGLEHLSAAQLANTRLMRRERKSAATLGLDAASDPVAAASDDPYAGKLKDGFCGHWKEGSSIRDDPDLREDASYFRNVDTQEKCWANCDDERACEQAVYDSATQECFLGINAMPDDTTTAKADNTCYAKNGFAYTLTLDVKDGWCDNFQEGWGGSLPEQCSLTSNSGNSQLQCSHWGAEFALSERGCWAKCQMNGNCKQAVYENKTDSWGCFIGTNTMLNDPGESRCTDCNNRCYAKIGFGNAGNTPAPPAANPSPAAAATPAPTPAPADQGDAAGSPADASDDR